MLKVYRTTEVEGGTVARLFHSLVVFGAGLTVSSCGARSETDGSSPRANNGAGATGSTTEPDTAASTTATGMSGGPELPNVQLPYGIELTQWSCDFESTSCTSVALDTFDVSAYQLTATCPVDPYRPTSEADCGEDERLACTLVTKDEALLAVNCTCSDAPYTGVCASCGFYDSICFDEATVCGCAIAQILIN